MFSGVCLDRVVKYALKEVEKDVRKRYKIQGGESLLKTDILIGIKYLKY